MWISKSKKAELENRIATLENEKIELETLCLTNQGRGEKRAAEEEKIDTHEKRIQNMYPLRVELKHCINNGVAKNEFRKQSLLETNDAVHLTLTVGYSRYKKSEVKQAVKEICQKAVEYFD